MILPFHPNRIPEKLIEAYSRGHCGLLVGAGASAGAGLPLWAGLLEELIEQIDKNVPQYRGRLDEYRKLVSEPGKYLMLATELKETLGVHFEDYVEERFFRSKPAVTPLHSALTKLGQLKFIITTNYDTLIERTHRKEKDDDVPVCSFKDVGAIQRYLSRREFFILKAHGDASQTGNGVILTEHDYRTILYKERAYQSLLSAMFTMFTVVFVGASLTDPEINLLLRYIASAFQSSGPTHYALMPDEDITDVEKTRWFKDFNVQLIPVSKENNYQEVQEFVEVLAGTANAA